MPADAESGKIALVTGGGRGLGRGISLALAAEGHFVVVNYLRNAAEAEKTVARIRDAGGNATAVGCDASDPAAATEMVSSVAEDQGGIDILVNNAGYALPSTVDDITLDDFEQALRNNLTSVFLMTQACLPNMREKGWGRVINISSAAAQVGGVVGVHYAASKAGIIGLTHAYARELMTSGVTFNSIAPALVEGEDSDALKRSDQSLSVPIGRFGRPEEVAEAVMMLVRNGYMTGQTISVNGGVYMT